jgi:hypothetical protein
VSEAGKKRALAVIRAERKTRRKGKPAPREWKWDRSKSMPDYIGECSYIGGTLIMLAGTYEGSREDCLYVETACTESPVLAKELLDALDAKERLIQWIKDKGFDARRALDEAGLDPSEGGPCVEAPDS